MNQPAPKVSAADVERVIARDFAPQEVAVVRAALAEYGKKEWHRELDRVRLAILKMAAGNIDWLRTAVAVAEQDFRDVLCAAEYPRYIREVGPSDKNQTKHQQIIEDDWKQYRYWFESKKG